MATGYGVGSYVNTFGYGNNLGYGDGFGQQHLIMVTFCQHIQL